MSLRAHVQFEVARMRAGSRLRIAVGTAAALGAAVVVAVRAAGAEAALTEWRSASDVAAMGLLSVLVPYLLATGLLAEDVSRRTAAFLFSRPMGRASVVFGKFLAALVASEAIVLAAALLLALGATTGAVPMAEVAPLLARELLGLAIAVFFTVAACVFWSAALPAEAHLAAAIHLGAAEFLLAHAPGFLRFGSVRHLARIAGGFGDAAEGLSTQAVGGAAAGAVALGLVALGMALLLGRVREYGSGGSA